MEQQHPSKDALTEAYARSVEHERAAWHELQLHEPGSPERIRAWKLWSEAISSTNDAWRRLNAYRFAEHGRFSGHTATVAASHAAA